MRTKEKDFISLYESLYFIMSSQGNNVEVEGALNSLKIEETKLENIWLSI